MPVMFPVPGVPGGFVFWCRGCDCLHGIDSRWEWDGNCDRPTIQGSVLAHGERRCHLFVVDGCLNYLRDCEHAFAGQQVSMVPPPWEVSKEPGSGDTNP